MKYSVILKIFISIIFLVITEIIVVSKISSDINESSHHIETVNSAVQTVKQYKEIRSYYNDVIVSKITQNSNIVIDSNHKNIPNAIPLP
ncbi:MAG: histidine kinase, partial [Sulfurimonas sp.]|nr:histidine kinase [Sulfurimonas sp.]